MDAHSTVTAEEGDRYPLGPPDSLQGRTLPQTSVTGVTVEERPEPILFRETRARCMSLTVNQWLGGFDPHTRSHTRGSVIDRKF